MSRRVLLFLGVSALLLARGLPARAQEPLPSADVNGLKASVRQDGLWVSYRVDGAFSPAVMERLAGSSPVRFVHRVRLLHRRLFGTRVLTERVIETTAQYDNLTRQYSLLRVVNGVEEEKTSTESEEEMRRFMTVLTDVHLPRTEAWEGEKKATVQVRVEYEDTWLLFLLPWTYAAHEDKEVTLSP